MVHFRDRTYCGSRCGNKDCDRRLTEQVKQEAERWWGRPGAPIAVANYGSYCKGFQALQMADA